MRFVAILLILPCLQQLYAQEPSSTTYLGMGTGTMTFFGDVAEQNSGYSPFLGKPAFHLTFSNPVTEYLNGGLEAMFGTIGANERTIGRNLNFRTEIRSGGLFVAYNFNHFLREDRFISPIVSLGLSGFEFLSKADLYDAEGREYHYWDDGTIRSLDQSSSNASEAEFLTRDYKYESDLRELDIDGFGDYSERALTIPVGIGAEFKMGKYLNLNIHTRMYFTTTDYLDNVTDESQGQRVGNSANDKFLYTGFVLRYGLHKKATLSDNALLNGELLANLSDKSDEDRDGVLDIIDKCPRTPKDVQVDANGCPIDGDNDGVANYMDLELLSADTAYVDANGVTLTDEDFLKKYKRFVGGGETNIVSGTIESASIPKPVFTPRPGKKFMVQVGETEEGISQNLASLLLSIPDVQTITKGDTVLYMVGDYDNLPDAVRRQLLLSVFGIDGQVVSTENGVVKDESKEARKVKRDIQGDREFEFPGELSNEDVYWRVQVGAFRYMLSYNIFSSLENIITIYGDDGLTRYFSGVYLERKDAETYRQILHNSGFKDSFLAAFRGGDRINVIEAKGGADDSSSDELWSRPSPDAFDESLITYKIILAESDGMIEAKKLEQFRKIGSVEQISTPEQTVYLTGRFNSLAQATKKLAELHDSGLIEAEVVGLFNGDIITLDEIDSMRKN